MAFDFEISGLAVKFFDRTTFVASTWSWDFGDGDTSTLREPTHTYATSGPYSVTLTATCGSRTSGVTKTLNVSDQPVPPELAVSLSTPWLFGTEYGSFLGASYVVDVVTESPVAAVASGGTAPYSYAWTADTGFDFGTAGIFPSSPSAAATTFAAQLEYPNAQFTGWIPAVCTVTDAVGAVVTSSSVKVYLTASFDWFLTLLSTQELVATGTTTAVTSAAVTVTPDGGSGNYTYQWNVETDDGRITADSPTADSTTITAAGLSLNEVVRLGVNVTVTDTDTSNVVVSEWVQVILSATS